MRRSVALLVGILLLAACGGGGGAAGGDDTVTVVSAPNVFLSALYVGMDDGIFEEEGIKVEVVEVEAGTDSVAALVSGNAQFADIGFDDLAALADTGEESLVMVHNILNRVTLTLVMRKEVAAERGVTRDSPLEERFAALKGLKLGITSPGAPTDNFMRYYLREVGLDPDRDASIVAVGGASSLLAALEEGRIDAYHLSPPTPYVAEQEGFGTILIDGPAGDVPPLADFLYTGFAASRSYVEENPEQAEAFSRGLTRAMEKVAADPEAVSEQIADDVGSSDAATILRTLEALLPALSRDGCFTEETVAKSLDLMLQIGLVESEHDPAEGGLWTNQINGC